MFGKKGLGRNEDNVAICNLCNWQRQCASMEQIEFELVRHMKDVHKLRVLYRTDDETGELKDIPQ